MARFDPAGGQLPLPLGHRRALGRADFLVSDANRAAVAWLDRWPEWPQGGVAICGPAGCGKTHLAHVLAAMSGARLHDALPISEAAGESPGESAQVVIFDFPSRPSSGPGAGAETAPFWERPGGEEALLHLFNQVRAAGGQIMLTGRTAPSRWTLRLADLRSRLLTLPVAEMSAPDDALLAGVLAKHFADRQLKVGPRVIDYLLPRMERSFAAAAALAAALDAASLAGKRKLTVPLAREVLAVARGERAPEED